MVLLQENVADGEIGGGSCEKNEHAGRLVETYI